MTHGSRPQRGVDITLDEICWLAQLDPLHPAFSLAWVASIEALAGLIVPIQVVR